MLLDCPLDIAWDLFSDWGNWGRRWQTASLVSELREGVNRKQGCKRFVQYPEWFLTERILEIDNEKHFCSYNFEENDVLGGMIGYVACIQVSLKLKAHSEGRKLGTNGSELYELYWFTCGRYLFSTRWFRCT